MSEKREGNLFYDKESGRYDIRFGMESYYGTQTSLIFTSKHSPQCRPP